MKWVILGLAVLAAIILIVVAVGWMLPVSHTASRELKIAAPPDAVWRVITDIDAFPSWRPGVTKIERQPDRNGLPVWAETGIHGRITLAVERREPPRLLVTRIADSGLPFGGTWTYELAPDGGGTHLTITEHGEVYNPIFRFMSRFVFGHHGTIDAYLKALAART